MNSALLSFLGMAVALVTGAQGGRWLAAPADPQAKLVAELTGHADRAPARVAGDGKTRAVRRADDGMFYVEARVNGATVRFLVDTGASNTVLTPADAARAGVRANHSRDVVTASGAVRFGWGMLGSVTLAGYEVDGAVAAISNDRLPVSLLGQDMLSRLGEVRIAGDTLWLS